MFQSTRFHACQLLQVGISESARNRESYYSDNTVKYRLCGLDNCGNQSPLYQSVSYSKIHEDSAKRLARSEWFFYESLRQSRRQTFRFRNTLVFVLRTSRSSRWRLWLLKRWCARDFRSAGFPHLVESVFLPRIRDFIAQPQLSFFAPTELVRWVSRFRRDSLGEPERGEILNSIFWITSTPTSLLSIYSALSIGWRKKYMAWQKNRIIRVGTDLMSEKFQLGLPFFENLWKDSPMFKFKFTLVCL